MATVSSKLVRWLAAAAALGAVILAFSWKHLFPSSEKANRNHHPVAQPKADPKGDDGPAGAPLRVKTVRPATGYSDRVLVQPGTVSAYEVVDLYAKASGFLKFQKVDIGDKVKQGEVLAIVDVPELTQTIARAEAALEQAKARVEQMKARAKSAEADHQAAVATIAQSEANAKSASAMSRYRTKQHARMEELFASRSIDERLVDESRQHLESAAEAERAAVASIATSKAVAAAKLAKIFEAKSDLAEAEAGVAVAQAEHQRLHVQLEFATLTAPFDGVITARHLFPGDYVRAANEAGAKVLLVLHKIDRMRVVVQIPDTDVPYADVGDPAVVELDAFPGRKIHAAISRMADAEDPQSRLMRIEIDVDNKDGSIKQGMYGRVRIVLDRHAHQLSIPSACIVGRPQKGKASVFVVRNGKAVQTAIRVGDDDGLRIAALGGLSAADEVVLQPPGALVDGAVVESSLDESAGRSPAP